MDNVCISILNYNNGRKTVECIESVIKQSWPYYYIVIVDNCSEDDSVSIIETFLNLKQLKYAVLAEEHLSSIIDWKPVTISILRTKRNGGYSYGNNRAIEFAKLAGLFSYILLLNNDLRLNEDFVEEMIKCYISWKEQFQESRIALGGFEFGSDGKKQNSGFHYLNLITGLVFSFPHFASLKYIVGSCIFLNVDGPLMDESYFLYFDDVQYSLILRKKGYKLENCKDAIFYHEMGGTTKQMRERHKIIFKSMKHFYLTNYPFLFPLLVVNRVLIYFLMFQFKKAMDLLWISLSHLEK